MVELRLARNFRTLFSYSTLDYGSFFSRPIFGYKLIVFILHCYFSQGGHRDRKKTTRVDFFRKASGLSGNITFTLTFPFPAIIIKHLM